MLIIICRCWPLIHPFIYLFWKHVCAHLDGLWNLKQRGKIPSFWGMLNSVWDQPQCGHLHHPQMVCVSKHTQKQAFKHMHRCTARHTHRGNSQTTLTHSHTHPLAFFFLFLYIFFFTSPALPFSPGRFRVPQMCHQTLVSIWTWRKKEILDRKVYKKKTLWIFDILCTAASKWGGWRGKEKQL